MNRINVSPPAREKRRKLNLEPKPHFKSEIRNGYLWMSRVPFIRKTMNTPGRSFAKGGDAAMAWQEFLNWMNPSDDDQGGLNPSFVKLNEMRLSAMMEVSRQSINHFNSTAPEQRTDATAHRNLLFLATRTPPMPFDNQDVVHAHYIRALSRMYPPDAMIAGWKARQLIKKYNLPKTEMWFDAEIDLKRTLCEEEDTVQESHVKKATDSSLE